MKGPFRTRLNRIQGDVDSVGFLIDRLNEFLAGVTNKASTDLLDVKMGEAVGQVYLTLEDTWSSNTPGFSATSVSDLDPAEIYLVDFFHPLLDAPSLRDQLESGSPNYLSDRTFTDSMAQAYLPFFTQLEAILLVTGFSKVQTDLVLGAVMGTIILCSFPLWLVYRDFHGFAAFARVVTRLGDSLSVADQILNEVRSNVLSTSPVARAGDVDLLLSQLDISLHQALTQKANPYMTAFKQNALSIFARYLTPKEPDLKTQVESVKFWRNVSSTGKTTITMGSKPTNPADQQFPYLGGIYYNANKTVQARSFLALPEAWEALAQATRLVSQAGFWLYVNAANNPYGGRHPPHNTHENGGDFDLGWTYIGTYLGTSKSDMDPTDAKNHKENLARMEKGKPTNSPIYADPVTRSEFSLKPIPQDKNMPPTHAAIQKLAVHTVLQAVALSGLKRYLYADSQNMRYAATNLGLAISPQLDPWSSTKKAVIAFTEAMGHYNHIHAELFAHSTSDSSSFLNAANLTLMYELALERDKDDAFYSEMFQPRRGVEKDESPGRIKPFQDDWRSRSSAGLPSLLPVWLTEKRWQQFMGFSG